MYKITSIVKRSPVPAPAVWRRLMHSVGLTMSKAKRRPGHPLEKVIPSNRDAPPTAAAPLPTPKKEPAIQATNLPGLSDEDRQLFRQATRLVTPLNVAERYDSQPPLSHASASQLAQRRQQAMGPSINAPVSHLSDEYRHPATEGSNHEFLRAGQTPKLLRQLRRGKRWPQASIDLHGYTVAQARDQLSNSLPIAWRRSCAVFILCMAKVMAQKTVMQSSSAKSEAGLPNIRTYWHTRTAPMPWAALGRYLLCCVNPPPKRVINYCTGYYYLLPLWLRLLAPPP